MIQHLQRLFLLEEYEAQRAAGYSPEEARQRVCEAHRLDREEADRLVWSLRTDPATVLRLLNDALPDELRTP